ncbi:hypothetical protein N0V93_005631 [Gnomoniopsis smithogilvyi]|uniref:Uncharacterized protein n=1 Tax=Gnomoniopsis smithogilvyi TaxID=1191159 RepID=A0A9W8YUV5_9PEZI|nr:hypothetical protein N0V93_005631 [Gnomoniopsis smithogilvyi]
MRSLMRQLKRRRTSLNETGAESPIQVFELQSVPGHKKRNHRPEPAIDEEEEIEQQGTEPEPLLLEPPAVILTTPDGRDIDTFAHGLIDMVDESRDVDDEDEDEWDTLIPPPLLAEPPRTPTKRRPPPPRPSRPADLDFNTFILGPPDSDTTLVSPFADPQDTDAEDAEDAPSSWWSSWSSSDDASSDSSSSSSDSESDEMDFQYDKHTAGKTLYAQLTDGFVSFPPLSPDGSDDMAMKSFLDDLDEDDVRDAEELLRDEEEDGNEGADELIRAVARGESEWANAFSRPVPRWLWLKSSNSFPVQRLGPTDLRHGHSKLRQTMSVVDEVGLDEAAAEDEVARTGVLYL